MLDQRKPPKGGSSTAPPRKVVCDSCGTIGIPLPLDKAIDVAVAAEREACAKIADEHEQRFEIPLDSGPIKVKVTAKAVADKIRARGSQPS